MDRTLSSILILGLLFTMGLPEGRTAEPIFPGKTWAKKSPAEVGLDAEKLKAFSKFVGGRGCVIRHGYLVYSWGDVGRRADVASAAKVFYSHFLFKALEDEKITSLDEKVIRWEPRLKEINKSLGFKDREITWRHCANQTSCYQLREKPGKAYAYNDWQMALFWDTLFLKVYGVTHGTVDEKVFHPLLTERLQCQDKPTMMAFGTRNRAGRVAISVRDFARFGLLYLREGNWKGKQLISRKHAKMAVTSLLPNSIPRAGKKLAEMIKGQRTLGSSRKPDNQTDHYGSYSWLWWINGVDRHGIRMFPDAPKDLYGAFGHGGPRAMWVIPSLDIIVSYNDARLRKWVSGKKNPTNTAMQLLVDAVKEPRVPKGDTKRQFYFPPPGQSLDRQQRRKLAQVGLLPEVISKLRASSATRKGRWALWRHGYLVHVQGAFNTNVEVKSLRKTWHALAVGAALHQKRIPSLDQKISIWNKSLQGKDADATWRHVMTQTSGFDYPYGDYPAYKPGEMWTYSDKNPKHLCNALARAFGRKDYRDGYAEVMRKAYFDAIGMQGWKTSLRSDGVRFHFDLEDMGRLGLLVLARGRWQDKQLIPASFVDQLERKQTAGAKVNYNGPEDGRIALDPKKFPEAPYGFMTWVNTDGRFYPQASKAWAWASGAGGTFVLWKRENGIVFAGIGVNTAPATKGIPHVLEAHIKVANPLTEKKAPSEPR